MTIAYVLAPNIRYIVTSKCGVLAIGGKIVTRDALTGLPKSTYRDPFGIVANPPIMDIGSDGSPGYPVYWKVESGQPLYSVTTFDGSGNMIYTEPNYPIDQSITDIVVNVSVESTNYFRNEQFAFWDYGTFFDNDSLPIGSTQVATQWFFERTNLDASIEISQLVFAAGENAVPFSPQFGFNYKVTSPGADSKSDVVQFFESVQTLNNQQVTVGVYPKSEFIAQTPQIEVVAYQFFGTGGSTPIETVIQTIGVVDSYTPQQVTFVVPSIAGQVIGPNNDDYLKIIWRFNPTLIQSVTIADMQFQSGIGTGIAYPYITEEGQYTQILATQLLGTEETQGANIVEFSGTDTPGEIITVKQAIINTALEITNLLYCPYMPTNPNQYGAVVDSTTIVLNDDATYIADGVILQSDGNNIVSKNSFIGSDLQLTIVTAGKKFGIAQIVDSTNLQRFIFSNLFEGIVSAFTRNYVTSSVSPVFKLAVLGWTGTEDQPAKQIVASWNPAGTNPTLSANWNYISTKDYTITGTDDTPFVLEGIDLMIGTYPNIAFMVWIDSNDMLVGDIFHHDEWAINQGWSAFQPARPNQKESLFQAEDYLEKSYDKNNPLAWGYQNDKAAINLPCVFGNGSVAIFNSGIYNSSAAPLPEEIASPNFYATIPLSMKKSPSVTFYNPSLDALLSPPSINDAHFYHDLSVGGPLTWLIEDFEVPISVNNINQSNLNVFCAYNFARFTIGANLGYQAIFSNLGIFVNYVADATIGV